MTDAEQNWSKLSRHKGDYAAGLFQFNKGKPWTGMDGLMEVIPNQRGRKATIKLSIDQNGDGEFAADELIFKGGTGRQRSAVIDDLIDGSGSLQLVREKGSMGMCTLPAIGAVCTFSVRSLINITTNDDATIQLRPKGRFRFESMQEPVGPQWDDVMDGLVPLPVPTSDLI